MNLMENPPPPPPQKKKEHFLAFSRITLREETFANLAKIAKLAIRESLFSRKFILAKIRDKSFADGCLLLEIFCKRKTTLCKLQECVNERKSISKSLTHFQKSKNEFLAEMFYIVVFLIPEVCVHEKVLISSFRKYISAKD